LADARNQSPGVDAGLSPARVESEPSDAELLARARGGDQPAFARLVERHGPYLFGIARSLVRDAHDAEDVVQETFAAAASSGSGFRGDASVRTWLVAIATRQAALVRRRRKPWLKFWSSGGTDETPPPEPATERVRQESMVDARMDLATLLQRLDPELREVLVLRELRGLSYEQMAASLGIPRGTVESRLHRARNELRRLWKV
jgi:RNA polymerase sigma-70 factor (ECF subfamily)